MKNGPTKRDKTGPWFTVRNQGDGPVEILLYDTIGRDPWDDTGMGATEFAEALNAIPRDREITLRIHSPGGNVWDGLAMYNMIAARSEKITAQIDGIAFSAASWVAAAAKKTTIPETGRMMIHDAESWLPMANAEEMRKLADFVDKESDNIAGIYARKTGKSKSEMRNLMRDTTFFTGVEAKNVGLADEVTNVAAMNCAFDLSCFKNLPADLRPSGNGPRSAGNQPQHSDPAKSGSNPKCTMNRKAMIALLNKLAITFDESATDEQLVELLNAVPERKGVDDKAIVFPDSKQGTVTRAELDIAKIVNLEKEISKIRMERDAEKLTRISGQVQNAIDLGKIPVNQKEAWARRAMADETILNDLAAMPENLPGGAPVAFGVENNGNSTIENYRKLEPGQKRQAFRLANEIGLKHAIRRYGPRNANTLDANLVPDSLADALIVTLSDRLAPLSAFARNFSTDRVPKKTIQVPIATTGSAAQTDPTNFETGDTTLDNIEVAVSQLSKSFHITNEQLNSGFMLSQLTEENAIILANAVSDVWTALVLVGTFGTGITVGIASNFDASDLPDVWEVGKNYGLHSLILDGSHLSRLIPTDKFKFALGESGAYGFDQILQQNRWTGATANTVGFTCDRNAIAVASGLPVDMPSGEFLGLNTVTLPGIGISVQSATWFSRAGRVHWGSYDVMFGAKAGDTTAGRNLITA